MITDHEPTSTRLINIPIIVNNQNHKLLIYTNDLAIDNNNGLMIVPIPNKFNETDFGLVDVTTNTMKKFRKELFSRCDNLVPKPQSNGRGISTNSFIPIQTIGNYSISVASDLETLEHNVDWSYFNLPKDFGMRKKTLSDKTLYPFNCAYVVAKANKTIKDDGFGVIYPDPGFDYFPTAHEYNTSGKYMYDVKCYNFNNLHIDDFVGQQRCYNLELRNFNILTLLDKSMKMSRTGNIKEYTVRNLLYVNYFEKKGIAKNHNVILNQLQTNNNTCLIM